MTEIRLIPCPFCGSTDLEDQIAPYISCNQCNAFGPDAKDGKSAIEMWNQRAEVHHDDQGVPESWHIRRALSSEALRLLTSLPMDEIERRLRMDGPAVPEGREPAAVEGQPSDEEVAELVTLIREISLAWEPDACLLGNMTARQFARAAALLEQLSASHPLRPIPVSEGLPLPEEKP